MQTDNLNFTVLCICCAPLCVILQDMLGSLQLRLQVLETAITVHENLQMVWSCFIFFFKQKNIHSVQALLSTVICFLTVTIGMLQASKQ